MKRIKIWWCNIWHWGDYKKIILFYSNNTHKYFCKKCNHEYHE